MRLTTCGLIWLNGKHIGDDTHDYYLWAQRPWGDNKYQGTWDLFGGKEEEGMYPFETLLTEIEEEAGKDMRKAVKAEMKRLSWETLPPLAQRKGENRRRILLLAPVSEMIAARVNGQEHIGSQWIRAQPLREMFQRGVAPLPGRLVQPNRVKHKTGGREVDEKAMACWRMGKRPW